jgi:hypothetical protein
LLLDEINLAQDSVLKVLESALDTGTLVLSDPSSSGESGNGVRIVVKNSNCRLFATQNPSTGFFKNTREPQSTELLTRFRIVSFASLPSEEWEEILLKKYKGLGLFSSAMVKVQCEVKSIIYGGSFIENKSYGQISLRELLKWGQLVDFSLRQTGKIYSEFVAFCGWCIYGSRFYEISSRKTILDIIRSNFELRQDPQRPNFDIVVNNINNTIRISIDDISLLQPFVDQSKLLAIAQSFCMTVNNGEVLQQSQILKLVNLHTCVLRKAFYCKQTIRECGIALIGSGHVDLLKQAVKCLLLFNVPSPVFALLFNVGPSSGCPFADRCAYATKICSEEKPHWKEKYSDEWPEWILSTDLCTIPHGFQSNNAPGTKSFLFQPPFFIIYKTVGAEYNFLQFDDFNKPNIEKSILAMLTYDEETNRLKPQFAPHLILPYSNVLSLNNFLEFKMVDSKGDQILVSDNSQLFILLTLL